MLIFHFHIYGMYCPSVRNYNSIRIFVNDIPSAFLSIRGDMTFLDVLEDSLMKITNIIIVGFIPLTEYLITYDFFPRCPIYGLVKNQFYRVDNIFIKAIQIK